MQRRRKLTIKHSGVSFFLCKGEENQLYLCFEKQGHSVIAYDVNPEALETIEDVGGCAAPTPAEVASKADRIVTMLPNSQHVQTCYAGENGILK